MKVGMTALAYINKVSQNAMATRLDQVSVCRSVATVVALAGSRTGITGASTNSTGKEPRHQETPTSVR